MKRRQFILASAAMGIVPLKYALAGSTASNDAAPQFSQLSKPLDEWQKLLTPEAFYVLFEEGTEAAHSSPLDDEKREGTFICAACYLPLFASSTKYDSGTGWPSFYDPLPGSLGFKTDFKLIYPRKEYHCARCGGHQGHVFKDGPQPTGLRYCNNGVALNFVPSDQPPPPLRD
jgi:peptide-methionine (R)-S-oxide reductase